MLQRFRLDDPAFLHQIACRLEVALRAADVPQRGLLSITLAVPEFAFDAMPPMLPDMFYLSRASSCHKLFGLGRVEGVEAAGVERWCSLKDAFAGWQSRWRHMDVDATGLKPVAWGGFAFAMEGAGDSLPAAQLVVPDLLLRRVGDISALTFNLLADAGHCDTEAALFRLHQLAAVLMTPQKRKSVSANTLNKVTSEPSDEVWLKRVREAVSDIQSGVLDKVVLSRSISVMGEHAFDMTAVMAALTQSHPRCSVFALSTSDDGVFVGASPELLVRLHHAEVFCDALAGTAMGNGEGLLADVKNAREHRLVVQSIAESLRPLCAQLEVPAAPVVLNLGQLHHLWSSLQGRAKPGVWLLDLLERVHPTPAVGGYPRQPALDWLARHGESRPGWYTGAVGWLDVAGEGEFAVALRCAHIHGKRAELHAGAGIVAGSDPHAELAETEAKLAGMLAALSGKRGGHG